MFQRLIILRDKQMAIGEKEEDIYSIPNNSIRTLQTSELLQASAN
jgi:hypothetical protein